MVPLLFLFQSTPSARRATVAQHRNCNTFCYFNPRPPRGERRRCTIPMCFDLNYFNPRPPRGERLSCACAHARTCVFQSTPSARRATALYHTDVLRLKLFQSTPSARRATLPGSSSLGRPPNFNPRPPRGERHCTVCRRKTYKKFQSTPSARRATAGITSHKQGILISIHALREESDVAFAIPMSTPAIFQSTPSARRATPSVAEDSHDRNAHFNPRPPRGERPGTGRRVLSKA